MVQIRKSIRHTLNFSGALLGASGIVFVFLQLRENADQIAILNRGMVFWIAIGSFAIIIGAANLLLARAWWLILLKQGAETTWPVALRTYGLSQLAKYIPGNIFHLAGRQILAQAKGLGGKNVARSILYELMLLASSGVLFPVLVVSSLIPALRTYWPLSIFLILSLMVVFAIHHFLGTLIAWSFIYQTGFLAISDLIFIVTLILVDPTAQLNAEHMQLICGAYVTAWLIGFITPGAPAGLGVRELVLLVLLENVVIENNMLAAVLLSRVASTLGDILFFQSQVDLELGIQRSDFWYIKLLPLRCA